MTTLVVSGVTLAAGLVAGFLFGRMAGWDARRCPPPPGIQDARDTRGRRATAGVAFDSVTIERQKRDQWSDWPGGG